jgi:hypothetical protein
VKRQTGIVYKLTTPNMRSIIAGGHADVKYSTEAAVSAPDSLARRGYLLTAFKNKEVALAWAPTSYRVWEAEATGVTEVLPPCCSILRIGTGQLMPIEGKAWPAGTVMCKTIKLLREITDGKAIERVR